MTRQTLMETSAEPKSDGLDSPQIICRGRLLNKFRFLPVLIHER